MIKKFKPLYLRKLKTRNFALRNAFSFEFQRYVDKEKIIFIIVYLNSRADPIKITKTLNRCNSEHGNFRSINERSLETENVPL